MKQKVIDIIHICQFWAHDHCISSFCFWIRFHKGEIIKTHPIRYKLRLLLLTLDKNSKVKWGLHFIRCNRIFNVKHAFDVCIPTTRDDWAFGRIFLLHKHFLEKSSFLSTKFKFHINQNINWKSLHQSFSKNNNQAIPKTYPYKMLQLDMISIFKGSTPFENTYIVYVLNGWLEIIILLA